MNEELDNGWRKDSVCPYCSYKVDSGFLPNDPKAIPRAGDLTLCIQCAEVSQFDEALEMHKFDVGNVSIEMARHISNMQYAIKAVHRERKMKEELNE